MATMPRNSLIAKNAELLDKCKRLEIGSRIESMIIFGVLQEVIELQGEMFGALRAQATAVQGSLSAAASPPQPEEQSPC